MSSVLDIYRSDFREDAWREYAACFAKDWESAPEAMRAALLAFAGGDESLAMGICGAVGSNALVWLDASIPALGGKTPRAVLALKRGREALCACIMRMPV
jgi:hypothetical protein